jgi:hypothetical protein
MMLDVRALTSYSSFIDTAPGDRKMARYAYINNTGADITGEFHAAVMTAIENGGEFTEDLADIFVLTKTPEGSAAEYALNFA